MLSLRLKCRREEATPDCGSEHSASVDNNSKHVTQLADSKFVTRHLIKVSCVRWSRHCNACKLMKSVAVFAKVHADSTVQADSN